MRSAATLLVLLAAPVLCWAQPAAAPGDVLCDDDRAICKETCTLELGTSNAVKDRIARCLGRCEQAHTVCLQRQIAKRKAAPRAGPTEATPAKVEPEPEPHSAPPPTRYSAAQDAPAAAPVVVDEATPVRRTSTRTSELEPAPETGPVAYPARETPSGDKDVPAAKKRPRQSTRSELDAAPAPKGP